ncbi:hypothetical protein M901_2019 [Bacteriovorax sp. DB6_IX]|nr:hypothetical protein M901_2019 [Bacteriovorax sp. DB6_IX]
MGTQVLAKDFITVGVSGFGTRRAENYWQPSGAHDNLPTSGAYKSYKLVHYAKKKELQQIVDNFECSKGKKGRKDLGLIVMANSWGSYKAIKLTKMYKKACGEEIDLFIMVDGVKKPIAAQGIRPKAKKCVNFYQTRGVVRGKAIKGCENHDMTKYCYDSDSGVQCHIRVEWSGTADGAQIIRDYIYSN